MHKSSYDHMARLAGQYLSQELRGTVVDIGSQDVNGSYRPIFDALGWTYKGADIAPGANVDLVLGSPYRLPLASHSIDLIISGQAFEHVEFFWLAWLEMARVVKPGGHIFLIAPSRGPEHRHPVDCWRFYPDGYRALAAWGGVQLIEVNTDWLPSQDAGSAAWGDTLGVFRKPRGTLLGRVRRYLHNRANALLMPHRRMDGPPVVPAPGPPQPSPVGAPFSEPGNRDERFEGRRVKSDIPQASLTTIQAGTLKYRYKGLACLKNPFDLALYTRLIFELKPRTIFEIGSHEGGSALWFADTMRRFDIAGRVVSIDLRRVTGVTDPAVTFLQGDAGHLEDVLPPAYLRSLRRPFLVVEDVDHMYETTLSVLRFFGPLQRRGEYMVVEDGIVNDLDPGTYGFHENGPNRAIFKFLEENEHAYAIDTEYCDHFGHNFTYATNGYLRKTC